MIGLLQRVVSAGVDVEARPVAAIGPGLLVLVGVVPTDDEAAAARLLDRLLNYRVFADAAGRMNLSLVQARGALLLVPQFTLAADTAKGLRPGFSGAASHRSPAGCSISWWPRLTAATGRCKRGYSAPTCRCRWSTTDR